MPVLWSRDRNRLIGIDAGERIEAAGLWAGEPRSEGVQALSAAGVAIHISENCAGLMLLQAPLPAAGLGA